MHTDHSFWPWHEFGMFPGFIFLLIIIGIIFLVIKVGRNTSRSGSSKHENNQQNQQPIDILKMRLAKGEIDQEAFERIKKTLSE